MKLLFIRHGEGMHTTDLPFSLNLVNPTLTNRGYDQIKKLKTIITPNSKDLIISSPTIRTIQSAKLLVEGLETNILIHPITGPRIYPAPLYGIKRTLNCDSLPYIRLIKKMDRNLIIVPGFGSDYWEENKINTLCSLEYTYLAIEFFNWMRSFKKERVIIISHDGSINWLSERLQRKQLSRNDFLGEAGYTEM